MFESHESSYWAKDFVQVLLQCHQNWGHLEMLTVQRASEALEHGLCKITHAGLHEWAPHA